MCWNPNALSENKALFQHGRRAAVRPVGTSVEQQTSSHFLCMRTQCARLSKNVTSKHTSMHATLLTLLCAWLEKHGELQQQKWGKVPEQKCPILYDTKREITLRSCWESHNEQELYLLAKSTTAWVIALFLSRNAKGDFLIKFCPAAKKVLKHTCNSTWKAFPLSPPRLHSPVFHETKHNKKQNHPKWVKLWLSVAAHLADFLAIFREPKGGMNCYGNKLMFWDFSFHYRKQSIWKHYSEKGHTKFPYRTLLILARSSWLQNLIPNATHSPHSPFPSVYGSTALQNWVTCHGQAGSVGKKRKNTNKQHKNKPTTARTVHVFAYNWFAMHAGNKKGF